MGQMAFLVFDVAVSRWHSDKATKEEPRVVRVAWWRSDSPEPGYRLIRPEGPLTIDSSTVPHHGVTLMDLERGGSDASAVVRGLEVAAAGATKIVSFNSEFHWRHLYRLMGASGAKPPATSVDVMALAAPILRIPLMRPGGGWKSPSLREACRFFDLTEPATAEAGPEEIALSTVRAVRGVYEACLSGATPDAA